MGEEGNELGLPSEPGVGPVQILGPSEGGTNIGGGAQVTGGSALIMVYDGSNWWPNSGN